MAKEKMYSLAIRKRLDDNDHFWCHADYSFLEVRIPSKGKYWFADPFVFEKDGVTYIFYEAFDLIQQRGLIGYSVFNQSTYEGSAPTIIIDEPFHLSFPNIFEYNGDIYIMPESCEDYTLHLYKATQFPEEWERVYDVLPDAFVCDSIFMTKDDEHYLLTNNLYHHTPTGTYPSCWLKNYLYRVDGVKVLDDGVKVAEGEFGTRNAGKSFEENGKLYRMGQDCRFKGYGRGMVLFEVQSLSPYSEKQLSSWTYEDMNWRIERTDNSALLGVHTYNFSKNFEIIDFSQLKCLNLSTKIFRLFFKLKRVFRKIIGKLMG